MSVNYRSMKCSPEDVFAVIADGWLFPVWVVGASRMREVDAAWPAVGAKLKHSFGSWPVLINDETTVEEWDAPRHAVLRPKGWPIGEALVTIDVKPSKRGCLVRIHERAIKGPGTLIPSPIMSIGLHLRNIETLRRLSFVAEARADKAQSTP
jgi:hypothetical protein